MGRSLSLVLMVWAVAVLVGCAKGQVEETGGFLGEARVYSQLEAVEGTDNAMLLRNFDPANPPIYDRFIIDPVVLWLPEKVVEEQGLEMAQLQALSSYFERVMVKAIGQRYPLTDVPGAGTLRIQAAITNVEGTNIVGNTISSVLPFGVAMSFASKIVTGEHTNVGAAEVEVKFVDSVTGDTVAAFTDRKAGDKYSLEGFTEMGHAQQALERWAKVIRTHIDRVHGNR